MILGIDVSRWQGTMDFQKAKNAGAKFAAVRCTVGDYYTDSNFVENWKKAKEAGLYVSPYVVIAPATSTGRDISAQQHFDLFMEVFGDRKADFPIVFDVEVDRGKSRDYINNLLLQLTGLFKNEVYNHGWFPVIYTRQSFWDTYVTQDTWWSDGYSYLWAARYSDTLTSPWSDGYYKFAGWNNWTFWQWSADGNLRGSEFGAESLSIDINYFNGSLNDFQRRFGLEETEEPVPQIPERVTVDVGWLGLRTRTSPEITNNVVPMKFRDGMNVKVLNQVGDWYQVEVDQSVWIHKAYTR